MEQQGSRGSVARLITRYRVTINWLFGLVYLIFARPTYTSLLAAALVVGCGEGLRVWASGYIRKSTRLATSGPYAFARHPLYLGSFIIGLGFCLGGRSWWLTGAFILLFPLIYGTTMKAEERRLRELFPDEYPAYAREVPSFFPLGKRYKGSGGGFKWKRFLENREHKTLAGVGAVFALLLLKIVLMGEGR